MHLVYPPPTPEIFHNHCLRFLFGRLQCGYAMFFFSGGGEVNKMHCGVYKNCEFATLETRRELGRVKFRKDFWDCY